MLKANVKKTDRSKAMDKTLAELGKMQVLVGIPQAKAGRKKGMANNAELMYIHTHGSPLQRIPARPVIEPAIEASDNKEHIGARLKDAGAALLSGDKAGAVRNFKLAGMEGERAAKAWFTDARNNWVPNAPRTVAVKGSDRPLIDTGELRKSITHVVKE